MATAVAALPLDAGWLKSRRWDLTFITLSIFLVATPYLLYLVFLQLPAVVGPLATTLNTTPDDISRNAVNLLVALLLGGPHMYSTFTRTALDKDFARKNRGFLLSSLLIPLIVVLMAVVNLSLLLTVFFFWASIHVLHQIIYITDLYNKKKTTKLTLVSRWSDYALVLTCLYPLAAWRIASGTFTIGTTDISGFIGSFLPLGPWMIWAASAAFLIALVVWIGKSIAEYRQGVLHGPKTLFLGLTALVSFSIPALGNLDTAFQGMNVWHSLQYLALTWMLNNLRWERGELKNSRFVTELSAKGSTRKYYGFNIALTVADGALAVIVFGFMYYIIGTSFDFAFDRAYYIAVLSFLWVHYYYDHFLFTKSDVIVGGVPSAVPAAA
ncbi:MAG TPA: hypothetical protein VLL77_10275 [Anaerolineales bacterium]|nr:hypothetical protein [Anaerolineales bacterium]